MDKDGLIYLNLHKIINPNTAHWAGGWVYINGRNLYYMDDEYRGSTVQADGDWSISVIPVSKGDTITYSSVGLCGVYAYFIPYR